MTDEIIRFLARLKGGAESDAADSTTLRHHGDRKELSREREKKIAMGHKVDDYEEQ